MPSILAYHRPESVADAATLLADPTRLALAGGTVAVPDARVQRAEGVEMVDLQALGLDQIGSEVDTVRIGAMVRLAELATDGRVPDVLRDAARREAPSALRNQATVGGTIALAPAESLLYTALLAYGCEVEYHDSTVTSLAELGRSAAPGELIIGLTAAGAGTAALAVAGRTPADDPIVAAVARNDGQTVSLALAGVADTPVAVDPSDPTAGLSPPGDFRGSSEYRLHLAGVLATRVWEQVA